MKILVAGDWHSHLHEEVVSRALRLSGHEVVEFKWCDYFAPNPTASVFAETVSRSFLKFQNKFICGPAVARVNGDLLKTASETRPDAIFIYRGTHISRSTLRRLHEILPKAVIAGYNNDDPFSSRHAWRLWSVFLQSVPEYDVIFAYRDSNIKQYISAGAKRCELLQSWYIPWLHKPPVNPIPEESKFQVVFVGHYEPDGRAEMLESLLQAGISVKLFGPGYDWDPKIKRFPKLSSQIPVKLVWGEDYVRAIAGAKLALCFLSKLNNDTYTRRCFEIPAVGTMLLSEYSKDLPTLYGGGIEADYFKNGSELVEKVQHYLSQDALRKRIAAAGLQRVVKDCHDVVSRMDYVVDIVNKIKAAKGN